MFSLQAVTVCVRYSDFLVYAIPFNKPQLNYWVVVTAEDDLETQKVCEFYNIHCIKTPMLNQGQPGFQKGKAINLGLNVLSKEDWVLHFDADIALPPQFRRVVEGTGLDKSFIYGMDRFNVKSYSEWESFLRAPKVQYENSVFVHPTAFELGVRVAPSDKGYWLPIGYFQMWHPKISGISKYPEQHTTAGRGDMLFAEQWTRNKRSLIPECIAYHLESEQCEMGKNWSGRKTKLFAPDPATVKEPIGNHIVTTMEY